MKKSIAISLFLILGLFVSEVLADQETLFWGQYERTTKAPNEYEHSFSIHGSSSTATLTIKNGAASGANRISSAVIDFNGQQISGPKDFSQQVYQFEAAVDLVEGNTISVELRGGPGGYLTIEVINTLPVAEPQSITTKEDTAATITVSGSDAESDELTYAIAAPPGHGTATISGSDITYTPAADYHGPDSFTFTVDDGASLSEPATVAITVTPVNDAPVANGDTVSTDETVPVSITLQATDIEGDALAYEIVASPANGVLSGDDRDNSVTYTPDHGFSGDDAFTFRANDGQADSNIATVQITVIPNDPPSITVLEPNGVDDTADSSFTIQWSDDDPDDDATISLYYDTDNSGANGTLIVSGLSEDADLVGDDEYEWDTGQLQDGEYYVYAVIDDGINDAVVDYSDGWVTISHGATASAEIKLTASDAAAYDYFGESVYISGDYAIVGADGDDDRGSGSGSVYIFKRQGSSWAQVAKLTANDGAKYDHFGSAVSISGDYAIVGAPDDVENGSASGSAYVFKREVLPDGTEQWLEHAKLTAGDAAASDHFGTSVSISGDYAIVGADDDDDRGSNSGSAYIFKREVLPDGPEQWGEQVKLTANDGAASDYFGSSVSLSETYAIVGAYGDDDHGSYSGSAYIFERVDSTWSQTAKLTASDATRYVYFAESVSISGNYAIVSAGNADGVGQNTGAAYIFQREGSGWIQMAKLTAGDATAYDSFGDSVSISGNYAIAGATGDDDGGNSSGSVYIFKREVTGWIEQNKVIAGDAAEYVYFGETVSISDGYAIVGVDNDDDAGNYSGSAYIYSIEDVIPLSAAIIADPEAIVVGGSTTLSWSSANASSATIDQGIGNVDPNGSIIVTPTETTTYTITATGPEGTATASVTVTCVKPPVIDITEPADGSIFTIDTITVSGNVNDKNATVTVNGITASVTNGVFTANDIPLALGSNSVTAVATNLAGSVTDTITVIYDEPPQPVIYITSPSDMATVSSSFITVSGTVNDSYADVWINGIAATVSNGVFTAEGISLNPGANRIMGTILNQVGTGTDLVWVVLEYQYEPQPPGAFGEQYEDLVPSDSMVVAYDTRRFSLITGLVQDPEGAPIADVAVTILDHPQYGTVYTDLDGRFSIPVEGGSSTTLVYQKDGLITSHRKVHVPWNDIAIAETATLISLDPAFTTFSFDGNPETVVIHRSTEVTDEFGSRSATLVLTGDNQAYEVDATGQVIRELTTISTRATEYTTPESMPAKLPPNSGYTYCVELSVDDVERVRFNKPVVAWIDNFLGFNVGMVVPVGYYDRDKGFWVPADSGTVVKLLDSDFDGIADALDASGDDLPDDLNNNGSFSDEVLGLDDSLRYAPGLTFWRVSVTHFTPWDCNWPFGPPSDAIAPNAEGVPQADQPKPEEQIVPPDDTECFNSYVKQRNRIFHEDISIPGTDLSFHYASNRVSGYQNKITVPVSGDTVPTSLKRIIAKVNVGGRTFEQILPPLPNQETEFIWDKLDHLGRPANGKTVAHISTGFVYDALYFSSPKEFAQAFGQAGDSVTPIRARQEVVSWRRYDLPFIGMNEQSSAIAEGWTLSSHHYLSLKAPSTLYRGDGTVSKYSAMLIDTVAGIGDPGACCDGLPATEAWLDDPINVAVDFAGNLYIVDFGNRRFRKVDTDGIITSFGSGYYPDGFAVDASGNMYFSENAGRFNPNFTSYRIMKLDPYGNFVRVAGKSVLGSDGGYNGDGIPAKQAELNRPKGIAVDNAGNLYFADSSNHRIRKVDANGIISTVAGSGISGYHGDGGSAVQARVNAPYSVALDTDGSLYIADKNNFRIRKVSTNGIITTVAGNGVRGYSGDGGLAIQAKLNSPRAIAVDTAGNLYILDGGNHCIRMVDANGIIRTVAGNGNRGYSGDGGPAADATLGLSGSLGLAVDASGNLFIADTDNHRIRKVAPAATSSFSDLLVAGYIPFAEENGLGHIFTGSGLHKTTIDTATGVVLRTFGYNEDDKLVSITDRFDNQTVIERDGNGVPTAIISPDGLETTLSIDANNHLTRIKYPDDSFYNPDGSFYDFEYTLDGLMTTEIEPEGNRFDHIFDTAGRLIEVRDGESGQWTYDKSTFGNGEILIEVLTGEKNLTAFLDRTDSTGAYTSIVTDPTGVQTLFSQSADGLTVEKSLPCGMTHEFKYDVDHEYKFKFVKEIRESAPSGLQRITLREKTYQDTNEDDVPDLISEEITVNNKITAFVQDTLAAQKEITSPEGRTATTIYDPFTLLTESVSVPNLFDTTYGYDERGRLTSTKTNTRQTKLVYDSEGFLKSVTDPENQTTSYSYDPVGRITGISRPDGGFVGFAYDKNGNMTVLTNPVDVDHGFGFNGVNRNSSYQTPLSGSYSYIYDKDRRLIQTNFPSGKSIFNDYANPTNENDKSRLWQIRTPEDNIDFTYLCGTKVESITKDTESITYDYDGKLVTSETLAGMLNQSIGYTYNNDFDVAGFTYAGGTVDYSYDNDGLLTGAGSFTIARNADNGLPEAVAGGALNLGRAFNGYGEVESQDFTIGSQNVLSWSLTRDNNGRITRKTETANGVISNYLYTYDSMGRLLTVTKDGNLVEEYGYDLSGTRISETNTSRAITGRNFSYSDEDHLLTAGLVTYDYDLDGFLTAKTDGSDVTDFTYSSRGELLNVSLPDGRTIEYVHDPQGRRIAKKFDGATVEKYLWQGLTRLLAVYDGADNLLMRFEYADGRLPVAVNIAGNTYYLTYDQVGSLRLVADFAGNVVKSVEYDSFGNILNDSNPSFAIPFGFAGGLHDRDTGLVRFGYRDYDPNIGRWTAKDPIGFAGGDTDLYGYVINDPVNLVDPLGLWDYATEYGTTGEGLSDNIFFIEDTVDNIFNETAGRDGIVTFGINGTHMDESLHYTGKGIDLRTRDLTETQKQKILRELRDRLGPEYDIVEHDTHIHLEYDLKSSPCNK